ncbi:MAG: RNA polymerase sigma factor [Lachnospiraceae bacterium]
MNIDKKEVNRLVMRLKEGDETAFDRLYSLLKLPLLKFVNGYTGNADASDDIVHNVFLCLYSRPIKNFSNCFGWIFTVARNLALNELNKSRFEVATTPAWSEREDAVCFRRKNSICVAPCPASTKKKESFLP